MGTAVQVLTLALNGLLSLGESPTSLCPSKLEVVLVPAEEVMS